MPPLDIISFLMILLALFRNTTHIRAKPTIFKGKMPESCSQFKLQDEMAVEDCEFGCD